MALLKNQHCHLMRMSGWSPYVLLGLSKNIIDLSPDQRPPSVRHDAMPSRMQTKGIQGADNEQGQVEWPRRVFPPVATRARRDLWRAVGHGARFPRKIRLSVAPRCRIVASGRNRRIEAGLSGDRGDLEVCRRRSAPGQSWRLGSSSQRSGLELERAASFVLNQSLRPCQATVRNFLAALQGDGDDSWSTALPFNRRFFTPSCSSHFSPQSLF